LIRFYELVKSKFGQVDATKEVKVHPVFTVETRVIIWCSNKHTKLKRIASRKKLLAKIERIVCVLDKRVAKGGAREDCHAVDIDGWVDGKSNELFVDL
jgi:hypothetical protein